MPQRFIFQYNMFVSGNEHPSVYLLSASFKSKDKAQKWAEKMQKQARKDQNSRRLAIFKVVPNGWKRPKNLHIPHNRNIGQATISSIRKLKIQSAK